MTCVPRFSPLAAIAALLFVSAPHALAVKGINPDGSLDKPAISKAYFEGEFWTVINALEAFRKSGFKGNREDSVYTFKYLSVVYAAEPSTRAKAESYMYQLIRMMPTIDLLDLYISDNIQSIFQKVKSDFEKIENRTVPGTAATAAASPTPAPAPAPAAASPGASAGESQTSRSGPAPASATAAVNPAPAAPSKTESQSGRAGKGRIKPWVPWALGGVGVGVGAAIAAFVVVSQGSEDGSDGSKTPRPVDVTMEWPKEGSP